MRRVVEERPMLSHRSEDLHRAMCMAWANTRLLFPSATHAVHCANPRTKNERTGSNTSKFVPDECGHKGRKSLARRPWNMLLSCANLISVSPRGKGNPKKKPHTRHRPKARRPRTTNRVALIPFPFRFRADLQRPCDACLQE